MLNAQMTGIIGDIPGEDTALLTEATVIQGTLSELDFEAGRRLLVLDAFKGSEAHLEPTVELPKISVPTFDSDVLNWAVFGNNWKRPYMTTGNYKMRGSWHTYDKRSKDVQLKV